jgi:ribosomal protein S18 acetylase RimI-like enzyme
VHFEQISDVTNYDFKDAINIYANSIPAAERQEIEILKERVTTKKEHLFIGRSNREVICMALIWPLRNSEFILLDYLAVKEKYRNQGIGTSLIKSILSEYCTNNRSIVIEIEDSKEADKESRSRRVAFYRTNGAKELENVPYILPPLQGIEPTKMMLMLFSNNENSIIEGIVVRKLITQIYAELYCREANDPLLSSFIELVPSTVYLK